MKTCNKCLDEKPVGEFFSRPRNRGGYSHQCKTCEIAKGNEWRDANRDRVNAKARGRRRYDSATRTLHSYKLTPARRDEILAAQGECCAICKSTEPGGRGGWHVDHDHDCCPGRTSCGKCIRGLLCARCNPMIGMARDNPEVLMAAAEYLHNSLVQALGGLGSGG